jgi:hypothetical protein
LYDGREPGALERAEELSGEIVQMCIRYGGSITGEHGIGMEKRDYLPQMFGEIDVETMWQIRTAIDPQVVFRNCVFRYGGSGGTTGALRCVNSSPTVDSTLFAYNHVGISAEGSSNPVVRGSSLYGNTYYGINNTGGAFCVNADR